MRKTSLLIVAAGALVLVVFLRAPDWPGLDVPGAALLVCVLPGAAILQLLFAPKALDPLLRVLLTPALSICSAVIAGVAMGEANVTLTRSHWAIALCSAVILFGAAGAWRRSEAWQSSPRPRNRGEDRRVRGSVAIVGAAAVAIALVVAGLTISARPVAARHIQGYAALGLTPDKGRAFTLFVRSGELTAARFEVTVQTGDGRTIGAWLPALAPGQTWTRQIVAPAGRGVLKAHLSSAGRAGSPVTYRVRVNYG